MQAEILDLQEVQEAAQSPRCRDGIAEYDNGLSLLLLQVVMQIEVLLLHFATEGQFLQRVWHPVALALLLIRQINDLWVLGPEFERVTQAL